MAASREARAHLVAQERLRALTSRAAVTAWNELGDYDERSVTPFVARVTPVVRAAQAQSIRLTDAYVARLMGRSSLGIDTTDIISQLRAGTPLSTVYRRPFVQVWSALAAGTAFNDAVASARARVDATAQMDVQLAHRGGLTAAQDAEPRIRAWMRVANSSACEFCASIDGALVRSADAMALHARCGCGLEPVIGATEQAARTPEGVAVSDMPPQTGADNVAVHEHGELGATLTSPAHNFTSL